MSWDYTKNDGLSPSDILSKSHKNVWWKCSRGHSWQAMVFNRTLHDLGCPYCSGKLSIKGETDLATKMPALCLEWDYERNIGFVPEDFTACSNEEVWWRDADGNHWIAQIKNRTYGSDSPYSVGREVSYTRLV